MITMVRAFLSQYLLEENQWNSEKAYGDNDNGYDNA